MCQRIQHRYQSDLALVESHLPTPSPDQIFVSIFAAAVLASHVKQAVISTSSNHLHPEVCLCLFKIPKYRFWITK
jgi:hypothetical protein